MNYELKRKIEKLLEGVSKEFYVPKFLGGNRYSQCFQIEDYTIRFFWKANCGYKYIDVIKLPDGKFLKHELLRAEYFDPVDILMDMPFFLKRGLDWQLNECWERAYTVCDESQEYDEDGDKILVFKKENYEQ